MLSRVRWRRRATRKGRAHHHVRRRVLRVLRVLRHVLRRRRHVHAGVHALHERGRLIRVGRSGGRGRSRLGAAASSSLRTVLFAIVAIVVRVGGASLGLFRGRRVVAAGALLQPTVLAQRLLGHAAHAANHQFGIVATFLGIGDTDGASGSGVNTK